MRRAVLTGAALMGLAAGCATEPPVPRVWVAKSAGTLQCEARAPDVARLTRELQTAGAEPRMTQCGHDGRTRAMICGTPDGRIVAFQLRAQDVEAAQRAGFVPVAQMAGAKLAPCP